MLCFGSSVAIERLASIDSSSCLSGAAEEFEAKPRRSRIKLVERTDAVQLVSGLAVTSPVRRVKCRL
jgi:hypothetical protein